MSKLPVLFLSHESPRLWDTPSKARDFLAKLGKDLPRPNATVVVSAHWQEREFTVSSAAKPETIYDFGGFGEHYLKISYPAPGSTVLANRLLDEISSQNIQGKLDPNRGFDHAVWIPVGLMYPKAEIPVVSLSIKKRGSAHEHYELGLALKKLRRDNIMILASGTATHNLRAFFTGEEPKLDDYPDASATEFNQWLKDNIHDPQQILEYRKLAPHAATCHPSPDHFMPLIVALGAGSSESVKCIHESFNYSHFAMTSFSWG